MNRGDIYWVDLGQNTGSEINKKRPCVIMSVTPINKIRRTVIIVPLSTSAAPNPPIVIQTSSLQEPGVMVCDQIRAVDKSKLLGKISRMSAKDLESLENSLRTVLGI